MSGARDGEEAMNDRPSDVSRMQPAPTVGVRVEDADGARWITLDRPPVNVLDIAAIHALQAGLQGLEDRRDIKTVVIRSAIARTFSAGVDVRDHTRDRAGAM